MHPTRNLFKEFPNPVYVETGAWLGDSIQLALDAGFGEVLSIELSRECLVKCTERFAREIIDQKVTLFHGDSAERLFTVIEDIETPITFWLDSHSQLLEDEPESPNPFPLMQELEQISRHHIKTHTIIIDDILILTHPDVTGWTKQDIEAAILAINPAYKIEYFANPVRNNILVAYIKI